MNITPPSNECCFNLNLNNLSADLDKIFNFLKIQDIVINKGHIYDHYGVIVENNMVVGVSSSNSKGKSDDDKILYVRETSFDKFAKYKTKEEIMIGILYNLLPIQSDNTLINTAKQHVLSKHLKGEYHVVKKNCEHYARRIVQGNEISIQSRKAGVSLLHPVIVPMIIKAATNATRRNKVIGFKDCILDFFD